MREQREQQGRHQRGDRHRGEHALAAELAQPEHQEERPREVVLLLDRERPEVLQQLGPPRLGDVRAVGDHLPPVARVRQRGEGVGAQRADRVGQEEQRVRDDDREQREQRGQEAAGAAQVERPQRDAACLARSLSSSEVMRYPLTTKNTSTPRNPPGAQPTSWPPIEIVVEHDDGQDRDRAQSVEAGQVPERRGACFVRGRGHGPSGVRSGRGVNSFFPPSTARNGRGISCRC